MFRCDYGDVDVDDWAILEASKNSGTVLLAQR